VRFGKRYLPLVALLGASLALIPTMAGGTTAPVSVSAVNFAFVGNNNSRPAAVAITPGESVDFTNTNGVYNHDVFFKGPRPASCSDNGNPSPILGPTEANPSTTLFPATTWSGTCTFTQPGVYTFYCTVHLFEGTVYVNAEGTVPTTTTTTTTSTSSTVPISTTTTSTTTTSPSITSTTQTPLPPSTAQSTSSSSTSSASSSTLGGPPPSGEGQSGSPARTPSVALAKSSHGATTVRGSAEIAPRYAGSRLEVDLLSTGASLARAKHPAQVIVGRLVRSSVSAGKVSFSVSLDSRGKRALRRHGRLTLTVRVTLTPRGGTAITLTRGIVLHR
jgi:plastocyanin